MNLIKEIDSLDKRIDPNSEEWVYDPLLGDKQEILREMARRIEALERQLAEANRHCKALHTIGGGINSPVDGVPASGFWPTYSEFGEKEGKRDGQQN